MSAFFAVFIVAGLALLACAGALFCVAAVRTYWRNGERLEALVVLSFCGGAVALAIGLVGFGATSD